MVLSYALRGSTGFGAPRPCRCSARDPAQGADPGWTLIGLVASITLFGRDRRTRRVG
jgi:hypothetical protein